MFATFLSCGCACGEIQAGAPSRYRLPLLRRRRGLRYDSRNMAQQVQLRRATEFAVANGDRLVMRARVEPRRIPYTSRRSSKSDRPSPITLRSADGLHVAIHESALVDYSAMWRGAHRQRSRDAPPSDGPRVRRTARSDSMADAADRRRAPGAICPMILIDETECARLCFLGQAYNMSASGEPASATPKPGLRCRGTARLLRMPAATSTSRRRMASVAC